MSKISEQLVKVCDTDSTIIGLNIKQLGAVGVMPVQLTDSLGVAIDTLPISGTFSLGAGVLTIGKVGLVDLSGDEINWADVTNNAIRVNVVASGAGDGSGAPTIDSYAHIAINLVAGANQVLVSSAVSKQIWVYGIGFSVSAAGSVSFQDEDDTAITGIMTFAASSGLGIPPSGNFAMPIWKLATNKDLEVDILVSEVDGWLDYAIVSV